MMRKTRTLIAAFLLLSLFIYAALVFAHEGEDESKQCSCCDGSLSTACCQIDYNDCPDGSHMKPKPSKDGEKKDKGKKQTKEKPEDKKGKK